MKSRNENRIKTSGKLESKSVRSGRDYFRAGETICELKKIEYVYKKEDSLRRILSFCLCL